MDGTKLKANTSKHKALSYDRMVKEEGRLQAEVNGLLQQATEADAQDDARYGMDRAGDELPAELAFREGRLQKIREAKMEQRQTLHKQITAVDTELRHLVTAISAGGDIPALIEAVKVSNDRRAALSQRLAEVDGQQHTQTDYDELE